MKKILIVLMLLVTMTVPAKAASDEVCGNSFMFFHDEVMFILKFESANHDLPCVSGSATLYWQDNKKIGEFSVDSKGIIKINGIGKFVMDGSLLYFLNSTTVIFDAY